jgi:hypothetical protein
MRSLAVKDTAETNILKLCKLTENYLKQKLKLKTHNITLNPLIQHGFKKNTARISKEGIDWFKEWEKNWLNLGHTRYENSQDDWKIETVVKSKDDSVAKAFKLLSVIRNFTAHIYNQKSILFKKYEECFILCLKALIYTLKYVK